MKAPKCRLCGYHHYGPCSLHKEIMDRASDPPLLDNGDGTTSPIPKPRFDRAAYQREYMRKRRAAMKEKRK